MLIPGLMITNIPNQISIIGRIFNKNTKLKDGIMKKHVLIPVFSNVFI